MASSSSAGVGGWLANQFDNALESTTDKVLSGSGPLVYRLMEDPWCPQPLKRWMQSVFERVWKEICGEIRSDVVAGFGWGAVNAGARETRLHHWPKPPRLFKCGAGGFSTCAAVPHFFYALRAAFLYADQPADGSSWKVLRSPLGFLIFLLKLSTTTSVATFALLFVLMDRRDEAQLVFFILKFKTFAFVSAGLLPAASLALHMHSCLAAVDAGSPALCIADAPSSAPQIRVVLLCELVRVSLILWAFVLLARGCAVGGQAEIAALEYNRLEAGAERAGRGAAAAHSKSEAASLLPMEAQSPRMLNPAEVERRLEAMRQEWAAEPSRGGALPSFMLYDVCVLCLCIVGWGMLFALPHACEVTISSLSARAWAAVTAPMAAMLGPDPASASRRLEGDAVEPLSLSALSAIIDGCAPLDTESPLFWSSLFNLKMVYGLLMFPFLVFEIPLIGQALTKTKATAYDATGMLVMKLGKGDVATLFEREAHVEAERREGVRDQSGGPNDGDGAAGRGRCGSDAGGSASAQDATQGRPDARAGAMWGSGGSVEPLGPLDA